jgi:hypothetical protein
VPYLVGLGFGFGVGFGFGFGLPVPIVPPPSIPHNDVPIVEPCSILILLPCFVFVNFLLSVESFALYLSYSI